MFSNTSGVRWLKLPLAVLIFYGIYKMREKLAEVVLGAIIYSISLSNTSLYVLAFSFLAIWFSVIRIMYILGLLGGKIRLWDIFKAYAISLTTVFSMVKFSDSVRAYYISKKGVPLTYALTTYVAERFFDLTILLPLGAILLGEYSKFAVVGLTVLSLVILIFVKFTHKIPDIRFLRFFKDFGNDLENIITPNTLLWIVLLSLGSMAMNTTAIKFATGVGWFIALRAFVLGCIVLATSPTPAGIGFYEVAVPAYLVSLGVPSAAALGGILVYRLFQLWLPSILGMLFLHREL